MDDEFDDIDDYTGDVVNEHPEYVEDDYSDSNNEIQEEQEVTYSETPDLITSLLKDRGIDDATQIQFEDDNGEIVTRDWNSLDVNEQLEILRSSSPQAEDGLDDTEIQLINAIRQSNLTPSEYVQYVQKKAIENYEQNNRSGISYSVDDYSDDELYMYDLQTKIKDVSQEELQEVLDKAKSNEVLFKKQVDALRNEYKQREDEMYRQEEFNRQQEAQQNYNNFAKSVEEAVINFDSIANGNLNLTAEDKRNLYEFITGFDDAGNSWFGKALNDPELLVKMAWFAYYGEQAFYDIQDFYNSEINKLKNQQAQPKTNSIYKPKNNRSSTYYEDDIDF